MHTEILKVDRDNPELSVIKQAAKLISEGSVVAFPTETVYGLGANALDENAVLDIFRAKGRPADNPLIVHIADISELDKIAIDIPDEAFKLAEHFWPGALTLILKKSEKIPYKTTGGLDTVAVRLPYSKVARLLIKEAGCPIAAPSTNISGKPSPLTALRVYEQLNGRIPLILDGDASELGLESTVLDLTVSPAQILRPGLVTFEMLNEIIEVNANAENAKHKSPGQKYRHYAPNAPATLVLGEQSKVCKKIKQLASLEEKAGILCTDESIDSFDFGFILSMGSRDKPQDIAGCLYERLLSFDDAGVSGIFIEGIEEKGAGVAVMNRLKKAAGGNIIFAEDNE